MSIAQGTPLYRAPEVGEKNIYGVKADILSLGIILYELLFGDPLFTLERARSLEGLKKLWTQTDEYFSSKTSERKISFEAMQFLQYCLQKDPDNRLQADELYELDFIRNAYNDEKYSYPSARSDTKLYLTRHNSFDMDE